MTEGIEKLKELSAYLDQLEPDLAIFFNLSNDLMMIADEDGTILRVNPASKRILGWHKKDVEGQSYFKFIHPDDLESTRLASEDLHDGPLTKPFSNRYRCADGTYRKLWWSASAYLYGKTYAIARTCDTVETPDDITTKK